jgi:hypothetical protein
VSARKGSWKARPLGSSIFLATELRNSAQSAGRRVFVGCTMDNLMIERPFLLDFHRETRLARHCA